MAHTILKDCILLSGGYDLSGDTNQLGLSVGAEMKDDTTFGDTTRTNLAGLTTVDLEHAGMVDYANADEAMWDTVGAASSVMTVCPTDGTDGEVAYVLKQVTAQYTPGAAVGDILAFTISAKAATEVVRGTVMLDMSSARTSTGTGSIVQLGAVGAAQSVYSGLHVIAASGTSPTLDVVIESDDNGSMTSGVTRLTHTQMTAIGSDWQSAAGAIADDYWRVSYTIGGSSPSFTALITVGIK